MVPISAVMPLPARPAIMIAQGDSLIVVIGDGFARLSQDTLAVEAHADLTPPAVAGADATQQRGFQMDPMPGYLLTDTTLYLMRPQELFAITTADGKLTRTALAKELAPLPNLFGGGGGRLGGGGGRPGAGAGAAGAGAGGGAGAANATGAGGATHHHHTNGGATTDGGAAATTAPATTTTVVEK